MKRKIIRVWLSGKLPDSESFGFLSFMISDFNVSHVLNANIFCGFIR